MSAKERIDWMLKCEADFEKSFAQFGAGSKITKRKMRRLQIVLEMNDPPLRRAGHA